MKKHNLVICFFIFVVAIGNSYSQSKKYDDLVKDYVSLYKDIAIQKMHSFNIPASITLAQGIIESGCGKSDLAQKANNHFGIKCHNDWKGETYIMDDDEKNECFRKYKCVEDSYTDHTLFLTTRNRYAFLFDYEPTNYQAWAYGLKQAGYATNPKYAETLIKLIEKYNLNSYDNSKESLAIKKPKNDDKLIPFKKNSKPLSNTIENEDFESVSIALNGRKIYENNGVKFFIARENDTFSKIAKDAEISENELIRYNDFDYNKHLIKGTMVYIEPKKRNAISLYYVVKQGDNPHSISQYFGVKLNRILSINHLNEKSSIKPGQKILLKKKSLFDFLGL